MPEKISIEVDLGQRAIEKFDVAIYLNGKFIESHYEPNWSYNNLPGLAQELRAKYPDAEIETWCLGEDCAGKSWRWKIEV